MSLELQKVLLVLSIAHSALVRAALECRLESLSKIDGDNETLFEFNFQVVGRERLLNGTINLHVDLDNNYEISTDVSTLLNGEWESSNIRAQYKTCMYLSIIYDNYFAVSFKDTNIPSRTCPIKKGEYYARNVELIADNWAQYAKLGLVRASIIFRKGNVVYGGLDVVLLLRQKIM
ncbi:uncharacterized protein LOC6541177 [Drosophila erecta]|uniref:MD-2-related lipid-recognition domain-containing protein n=1 Tax=Drosophila erecta TaxID=7220 RepID=B3N6W9_DROER|nr:uncharacterized protein LOC6541177 [Drosophila erecta]EDV58218.1 uncharacterized protein Dere_GG24101 [Drosophila erecta]